MTAARILKSLEQTWLSVGFVRNGRIFYRLTGGVSTFLEWQKGFGDQWFINVGFWIESVGGPFPVKVEHAHMYFRLERLFPEFRETIISSIESSESLIELLDLFAGQINTSLSELGTEMGLREAFESGYFDSLGLVRREAREYLSKKRSSTFE